LISPLDAGAVSGDTLGGVATMGFFVPHDPELPVFESHPAIDFQNCER
jgi:hypothetical protein